MAKIYCLNCDPQQPEYVRNEAYSREEETNFEDTHERDQQLLVCRDWAEDAFKTDPALSLFSDCGLLVSSPCQGYVGADSTALENRDRYTCGDDLVFPTTAYRADQDGEVYYGDRAYLGIEAFLNTDHVAVSCAFVCAVSASMYSCRGVT